jgi:hypothetical protein
VRRGGGCGLAETAVYRVGEGVDVRFEIDPDVARFAPAGVLPDVAGMLDSALAPLVEGAKVVLAKAREVGPQKVEVAFGVKATGTASFVVAKAASEGNFSITLTWEKPREG